MFIEELIRYYELKQNKAPTFDPSWRCDNLGAPTPQTNIFKRLQNLKKNNMFIKEYIEEFYKLVIWSGHSQEDMEKVARYLSGLKYSAG